MPVFNHIQSHATRLCMTRIARVVVPGIVTERGDAVTGTPYQIPDARAFGRTRRIGPR